VGMHFYLYIFFVVNSFLSSSPFLPNDILNEIKLFSILHGQSCFDFLFKKQILGISKPPSPRYKDYIPFHYDFGDSLYTPFYNLFFHSSLQRNFIRDPILSFEKPYFPNSIGFNLLFLFFKFSDFFFRQSTYFVESRSWSFITWKMLRSRYFRTFYFEGVENQPNGDHCDSTENYLKFSSTTFFENFNAGIFQLFLPSFSLAIEKRGELFQFLIKFCLDSFKAFSNACEISSTLKAFFNPLVLYYLEFFPDYQTEIQNNNLEKLSFWSEGERYFHFLDNGNKLLLLPLSEEKPN